MANRDQLKYLSENGVESWNKWRQTHPGVKPDLAWANLKGANLFSIDLHSSNLVGIMLDNANLMAADLHDSIICEAFLSRTNLSLANLTNCDLRGTGLVNTDFSNATMVNADLAGNMLQGAHFYQTNLQEADLSNADLRGASFVKVNLANANLTGARVYGIAAWDLELNGTKQSDLIISEPYLSTITLDNIELAQLVNMLLENTKLRSLIDTITARVVLIIGRFTPECKPTLEMLREILRERNYSPIIFDFTAPKSRTTLETVSILAHMSRFIIADLTDAKSVLQELQSIVPNLPSVPIKPIILDSQKLPGMMDHFYAYPWVLDTYRYNDKLNLRSGIIKEVILPLEEAREKREQ